MLQYKFKYGLDAFPRYETLPEKEMVDTEIPPGKKHTIQINARAGSTLSWNFRTEQYDIGFRVDCDETEPIIKYTRVDSHMTLQKGLIICQKAGKCKHLIATHNSLYEQMKCNNHGHLRLQTHSFSTIPTVVSKPRNSNTWSVCMMTSSNCCALCPNLLCE